MSAMSPVSGAKQKSDFGAVRAAFDPNATSARSQLIRPGLTGSRDDMIREPGSVFSDPRQQRGLEIS
jgi:hypothetical protein